MAGRWCWGISEWFPERALYSVAEGLKEVCTALKGVCTACTGKCTEWKHYRPTPNVTRCTSQRVGGPACTLRVQTYTSVRPHWIHRSPRCKWGNSSLFQSNIKHQHKKIAVLNHEICPQKLILHNCWACSRGWIHFKSKPRVFVQQALLFNSWTKWTLQGALTAILGKRCSCSFGQFPQTWKKRPS